MVIVHLLDWNSDQPGGSCLTLCGEDNKELRRGHTATTQDLVTYYRPEELCLECACRVNLGRIHSLPGGKEIIRKARAL